MARRWTRRQFVAPGAAAATILAATALETGKRQVYDPQTREIREG